MELMRKVLRVVRSGRVGFALLALAVPWSCRDVDPPRRYYADLGDADAPLLPTPGAWHNPAVREGQAEWVPFEKPTPEILAAKAKPLPAPAKPAKTEGAARPVAPPPAVSNPEIEALIEEFNGLVAKKDSDQIPAYFVERQREPVSAVLKFQAGIERFFQALEEKSPGQKEKLAPLAQALNLGLTLRVQSLSATSENEFVGTLPPPSGRPLPENLLKIRFVRGEEGWKLEYPLVDTLTPHLTMIKPLMASLERMTEGIRSGAVSPETVVSQLQAALSAMPGFTGAPPPGEAPPPKEDENAEPDTGD
jgi:hypothetical protein